MPNINCRLLCVDDHLDSAEMLGLLLAQQHYEVTTAARLAEALQLARANDFDLYLIDHHLPDGTGVELCEKLIEARPGIPCVFYTGESSEAHRQQALESGAAGYVQKPNLEELFSVVGELLSSRKCAAAGS